VSNRGYGGNNAGNPQEKEDYVNVRIGSRVNVRHWLKHVVLERHEDLWQLA
jgi:hypothetical protein